MPGQEAVYSPSHYLWFQLVPTTCGLFGSGLSGLASGELKATLQSMSAEIRLTRTDNQFVGEVLRVLYL